MLREAIRQIKISLKLLIILSILTGIIYPSLVTLIAQSFFPWQANGSIIKEHEQTVGSILIGQSFTSQQYFWTRPSATAPYPYNAEHSSGSNLGPSNPQLLVLVKGRIALLQEHEKNTLPIPVDLVTSSASGLDPEISPLAAYYQVARVAHARHLAPEVLTTLVNSLIKNRGLGILGEPRINVLQLNLALDNLTNHKK